MNRSRREFLIGMAGFAASSLTVAALAAEQDLPDCKLIDSSNHCNIDGFTGCTVSAAGMSYKLYRSQMNGPAVVILHELPGLYKEDIELGRRIAACGFTAYMPIFFGKPCSNHAVWYGLTHTLLPWSQFPGLRAHHTSKVARWLSELLPSIHKECGGKGVGIIGMCMTGTLPLALLGSDNVRAVVLCQPALPYFPASSLGLSDHDVRIAQSTAQAKDIEILAVKFSADCKSPEARWKTLRDSFPGRFHELIIGSGKGFAFKGRSHSVLGMDYGEPESPTHEAFRRVVRFLDNRISENPKPPQYPDHRPCPEFVSCKSYPQSPSPQ